MVCFWHIRVLEFRSIGLSTSRADRQDTPADAGQSYSEETHAKGMIALQSFPDVTIDLGDFF
jgi:predicted fused transcriptional regulator/phosphomethylpyrimidine kinase